LLSVLCLQSFIGSVFFGFSVKYIDVPNDSADISLSILKDKTFTLSIEFLTWDYKMN